MIAKQKTTIMVMKRSQAMMVHSARSLRLCLDIHHSSNYVCHEIKAQIYHRCVLPYFIKSNKGNVHVALEL
jgi:hypothetical protein